MNKIGEKHGDLTIIALSQKPAQGYLNIYWARCECGNIIRSRYDYLRKKGTCGMCSDFVESHVLKAYSEVQGGKKD